MTNQDIPAPSDARIVATKWLEEAALYFENRPTVGEDKAHWSNTYNAENCRKIASLLIAQGDVRRATLEEVALLAVRLAGEMQAQHSPMAVVPSPEAVVLNFFAEKVRALPQTVGQPEQVCDVCKGAGTVSVPYGSPFRGSQIKACPACSAVVKD